MLRGPGPLTIALLVVAAGMHAAPGYCTATVSAVRAKLVKPLDAHGQAASSFYLNTVNAWQSGSCKVRANTMIEGQVVNSGGRGEGAKQEELGLRFEPIACYGSETTQVTPILIAVHGPRQEMDDAGSQEAEMKQAMMSMTANRVLRTPGGGPGAAGASATNSGRAMAGAESQQLSGVNRVHEPEGGFKTGEVRDVRGVKMTLPAAGSDVTTLLSSHRFVLAPGTVFYLALVSSSETLRQASGGEPSASSESVRSNAMAAGKGETTGTREAHAAAVDSTPREEAASEANQMKLCAAGCAELDKTPAVASGPAAWSLSLADLGLRPRLGQVRVDLDDDASVHFLGENEILVTFNTHSLTPRSADAGPRPRRVRAVVLSGKDGRILQMEEWPVFDDRQYTWDLGDGRVLAHVGHELRIYGAGLTVEKHYRVVGPVLFAEVAPTKDPAEGLVAVATIHEKHTVEAHRKFATLLGPDWPIAEDYDVTMLDGNLEAIGTKSLDTKPAPVALLHTGMVSPEREHGQNWKLQLLGWDGKEATLAHLSSACTIGVTALPAKLLFLTTCAADQASSLYWILNTQGAVLLAGHAPGNEFVQEAQSSAAGDVVAIAVTQAKDPIDLKIGAKVSDFGSLLVSAYRASDGKRILAAKATQGSALRETFALAPSGRSLTILSGSMVQTYGLEIRGSRSAASLSTAISQVTGGAGR